MQFNLSVEKSTEIEAVLLDLLVRAEAGAVFLCDRGGNILVQNTTEEYQHEENIAALAAGSFFATRELARLIGEPVFQYIFHRGERTSIFMQQSAGDTLLLVVFGKESNPGLVKLYADETCRSLKKLIESAMTQPQSAVEIVIDDRKDLFKPAGQNHNQE
jgi:predicted regulator of Ras-like GTPase activity (Roadblock/LC7/MglB family)